MTEGGRPISDGRSGGAGSSSATDRAWSAPEQRLLVNRGTSVRRRRVIAKSGSARPCARGYMNCLPQGGVGLAAKIEHNPQR